MTEPSEPTSPTVEALRDALATVRQEAADPDALVSFNSLHEHLMRPELADDVVATAQAIIQPILSDPSPRPAVHAHMIILMSILLQLRRKREEVDTLFIAWLAHPGSYGPDRATPIEFQRPEFVQRVADLIGWNQLDLVRDHDALVRFFSWVNAWAPKQKQAVRRTVDALRRNFPAPDLWKRVRIW